MRVITVIVTKNRVFGEESKSKIPKSILLDIVPA